MRVVARSAAAMLVLASIGACHRSAGVLAEVGGRPVRLSVVAAEITAQTGRPLSETSPELAAALFETYLEEEVMLASSSEPSDRDLTGPQRSARLREIAATLCPPPPPPGDGEVRDYLASHADLQHTGERLLLHQLILPDQPSARAAQERARGGADFAALSRELSRAANADTGGAVGWIERGQLPPEFEAAVFSLPAGGVSAPVPSSAGWHVFKVVERRTGGGPDAGDLAAARAIVAARNDESARRRCLHALAQRVGVKVTAGSEAPFPCHNPFEETP